MSPRSFLFVFALFPLMVAGQNPASPAGVKPLRASELNATTRAVLLANRPERFTEEQWLNMMRKPVNRSLYPLRITPAMLNTLDVRALDPRFRYEVIPLQTSK